MNDDALVGNPIEPETLIIMKETLEFGSRLRGVRSRIYEELEPDFKQGRLQEIGEYTDRMIEHDSKFKKAVEQLPFSFPF